MGVEFPPLQETNRPTDKTNNTQNHGLVKKDTHETNGNLTTTKTWNMNTKEEKYTTQEQLNNITQKYKDDNSGNGNDNDDNNNNNYHYYCCYYYYCCCCC